MEKETEPGTADSGVNQISSQNDKPSQEEMNEASCSNENQTFIATQEQATISGISAVTGAGPEECISDNDDDDHVQKFKQRSFIRHQ